MVNNIAPLKTARIKNTSNEWFDRKIAEKLSIRDKLFTKFKSSLFNIDWEIYKEARNDVQRITKRKKKQYLEKKLSENIAKSKINGAAKQRVFSIKCMFKKQEWFTIRLTANSGNF